MPAYEALHAQHDKRRPRSFPPKHYADLTKADITALAPILIPSPATDTSAGAAFEQQTRQQVSDLPSYLRSKYPCLTTMCWRHKRLNPLPVVSLWNAIKRQIHHELDPFWISLAANNTLTATEGHFINRVRLHAWHNEANKCDACLLSRLATDNDLLIVLGAITLATLSPSNWRKSTRVYFFECQMQGRIDGDHAEGAKRKMFELGCELRRIRERLRTAKRRDIDRPHVAEFALRYQGGNAASPPRPSRSPEQDDYISVAASFSGKGGRLPDVADRMSHAAPVFIVPRKPLPAIDKPNVFDKAFQSNNAPNEPPEDDNASSVYSDDNANASAQPHEPTTAASSVSAGSDSCDNVNLHNQTVHSKNSDSSIQVIEDSSSPIATPPRRRLSRLARYSRHKLAPITIARGQYGMVPELRTSGLWARRFEIEPRLRVGKSGDVKGPFDPVSDLSLVANEGWSQNGWI